MAIRVETLCFRILSRCNLSCSFCRAGSSPSVRGSADVTAFKRFVRKLMVELGLRHVSISGGEPGLDRRLPDLVGWLADQGLFVSVTTNGTSRLSAKLSPTADKRPGRIRVRVSIDGDEALHDQFRGRGMHAVASEELRRINDRFGWVAVNTVVTTAFTERGLSAEQVFGDAPVDEWALITPVPQGSAAGQAWSERQLLPPILSLLQATRAGSFAGQTVLWNFLGTPRTSLLVKSDDEIVLAGVGSDDDMVLGNLHDFRVARIREAVGEVIRHADQTHFRWKRWDAA